MKLSKTLKNTVMVSSGVLSVLVIWELLSQIAGKGSLIPPVTLVLQTIVTRRSFFWQNISATLLIMLVSFLFAMMTAFAVASLVAFSRRADKALSPVIIASQAFPIITITPFLIALFGGGNVFIIFFAAYITWFPAVISFMHGLTKVDPDRLALFRAAGATRWQIYRHLQIPSASRYIVAGVRASAAIAFVDAVVAEYGGATVGVGSVIVLNTAGVVKQTPEVLVALAFVSAAIGIAFTWLMHSMTKKLLQRYLSPKE